MRKPSPAMLVALAAFFVALGGVGVAATGGSFILGQPNTATTNTSLSAPVAGGKALQLTNNDASNAASTALGLTVASGHAPFTVSNGIKVTSLNADRVDGFDSTYFLPKTGTAANSNALGGHASTYFQPTTGTAADSNKLGGQLPSYYLPASSVNRVGPINLPPPPCPPCTESTTLATIGQLTFTGMCGANVNAPGGIWQSLELDISSSADHAAYADLTQPNTGTTFGNGNMAAGVQNRLANTGMIGATVVFTPVTGEALSADGHEVFYEVYMGQNVGGLPDYAHYGQCVFGGSFVVR
jgi:hypothetical protein